LENHKKAIHFLDFPDGGGYPKGFLEWAFQEMGCDDPGKVLHLCSGSVVTGTTVDIRPEMNPSIIADCRNTKLPPSSYDWILADPPYSEEWAENLYKTGKDYPKPKQIVCEAERLLKPGGLLGIMHFQVPFPTNGMKIIRVYGIIQGCGYAIKAWTLMKKPA
jgi:SAM-dependent methyltransferase